MPSKLEKQMQKLKDMGVTVNVRTSNGDEPSGVSAVLKAAAQTAGIYYERGGAAPELSERERREADRFGIHDDEGEGVW